MGWFVLWVKINRVKKRLDLNELPSPWKNKNMSILE